MPKKIDETHDPKLESWVESANDPETDFPLQNLPFTGMLVELSDDDGPASDLTIELFVPLGDMMIDINALAEADQLNGLIPELPELEYVPTQAAFDPEFRAALRKRLVALFGVSADRGVREKISKDCLIPADDVHPLMPFFPPPDYTDFYASVHHATNVGSMFRPDNPLLPNYKWIPVGYHGRSSTVVASGMPVYRPSGQTAPAEEGGAPGFGPCRMLDYELEMGVIVGAGNELGAAIPIERAEDHILGLCLLNDWSARDMQKWEYQPLGPFLAKNFATSVSPYIVTMEALAPFRAPRFERPAGDPAPLPHLDCDHDREAGALDITLEVFLLTAEMKKRGMSPHRLSRGNFKDMYWTVAQMLTHHASNGCAMRPGDLLGSGTVSGPTRDSRGCLLELTWDGDPWANPPVKASGAERTPIELPSGEQRKFLEDGDEVIIKGYCERDGFRRIGFGECRGVIEPSGK
ncbi:MAG TPA: fumarylacetoacetase [Phycisphaerales bacterium]|nr:fumarylacetoacetase [Phycisphaerales bacterium]